MSSQETRSATHSVVFSPLSRSGGVKSLYLACQALGRLGRSAIASFPVPRVVDWFAHACEAFDGTYTPDVLVYPEIFQPNIRSVSLRICYALGKYASIKPHADLTVCRSPAIEDWVRSQHPTMPTAVFEGSIDRAVFEYDGRPKREWICCMPRTHKSPKVAGLLRARHGDRVVEITGRTEAEVADVLKSAKVFVWWGNDKEGSPRPPKEALVAGCVVVGLASELDVSHAVDFGLRCSSIADVVERAGDALSMPVPGVAERAVVRDNAREMEDWIDLVARLRSSS
ncbi:MAG: hypothetical protein ABI585_07440 [Betaproteobacteria bacterium]